MLRYSIILILSILLIVLLFDRNNNSINNFNTVDTVYIESTGSINVERPIPKLIFLNLPNEPIDTEKVVEAYYTNKVIIDTLKLDNYGIVELKSNLYKNNIDTLSFTYKLNCPVKQYNYMIGVGYDINGFQVLAGYSKSKITYYIGYSPKINNFSLGVQYRF